MSTSGDCFSPASKHLGCRYRCRVKIIDDDAFPSNKYRAQITSGACRTVPPFALMWEYVKFNWRDKIVRKGSTKVIFSDVLDNLYYIWILFLGKQLIELSKEPSDDAVTDGEDASHAEDLATRDTKKNMQIA